MSGPNILFIMSDQHAARVCGYAGHTHVRTPHLDRLAAGGTVFHNAYCNSPSCAPSRASFFTGMYPSDCNAFCNSTPWAGGHAIWGSLLGEAGYDCLATGKFDLHPKLPIGFRGENLKNGHTNNPDLTSMFRMPGIYRWNERMAVRGAGTAEFREQALTRDALAFLGGEEARGDKPWVFYLGYSRPHPPYKAFEKFFREALEAGVDLPEVPDQALRDMHPVYEHLRHFKRSATPVDPENIRAARAAYYASVRELDDDIGRVIEALEASGRLKDTIVVYTSDHGESLGENGNWHKGSLYDAVMRVPLIFSGPGIPAGKVVDRPVSLVDVTATLFDLTGTKPPEGLRGVSLRSLWDTGGGGPDAVYAENHTEGNLTGNFMVREGDWKLILFAHYDEGCLFNLKEDPKEHSNRFDDPDCAEIRDQLRRKLEAMFDMEAINDRAFAAQRGRREEFLGSLSEAQLADALTSRLGTGQARVLARRMRTEGL